MLFFLLLLAFCLMISCGSAPVDLRTLAPADALVYVETNDLGRMLAVLTGNKAFAEASKSVPDFSRLNNVQLAVVITGFETSENQVTEDNSILNLKPHFVAIAETHTWNWQALRLTENNLTGFIKQNYGDETKLEMSEKYGGQYFVWTAGDNRRLFGLVDKGRIYFSNDEAALEKIAALANGQGESLARSGRGSYGEAENLLAGGFISPDGINQIANIAGVSMAMETTEDGAGRSFIARFLPALLQNSVKEISWKAVQTSQGIEDRISVTTAPEVSQILKETMVVNNNSQIDSAAAFLPLSAQTVTRYDLQNPLLAWRSLLLVSAKQTDAASGKIVSEFAGTLLAPYAVTDAEGFLSSVNAPLLTARLDADGEKSFVIADVKNSDTLKKSIAEINFKNQPERKSNAEIWKAEDDEISAAFIENKLILGDSESVLKCLDARQTGENFIKTDIYQNLSESRGTAATFGKDSAENVIEVLGEKKQENLQLTVNYFTETRFTDKGIERKTISPFGLIGSIIEQVRE